MLNKIFIRPLIIIALLIFIVACSKDEPVHVHEEELITRVTLKVKKQGTSEEQTYSWNDDHDDHEGDEDHDEEAAAHIELESGSVYEVEVFFYNASDPSAIEDITEEVKNEADDHQVFYDFINATGIIIATASGDTKDSNGKPLMLKTLWTTTAVTQGEVRVYLIHEPISKTGSNRDDFGGETDVEGDFHLDVE